MKMEIPKEIKENAKDYVLSLNEEITLSTVMEAYSAGYSLAMQEIEEKDKQIKELKQAYEGIKNQGMIEPTESFLKTLPSLPPL